MDPDDLSTEAYRGTIVTAEKLNRDLTIEIIDIASLCDDEDEFLERAMEFINQIATIIPLFFLKYSPAGFLQARI